MSGRYPYQKLAKKLKYRILRGYYKPGTLLPVIRTLAEQEGCNPATVRRSLETLKQEGLVVCKGTLGFWINDNCSYIASQSAKMERPVVLGKCK